MVTVDPADVAPGEVWLVDAPKGADGVWVGARVAPDDAVLQWQLYRTDSVGSVWVKDSDVRLLERLVPARPVTLGDLPTMLDVFGEVANDDEVAGACKYRAAVVDRLNGSGGVPGDADRWRRALSIVERERDEARAERDEAVARAEAAEARTAPAVSRADVAETLSRCINPEMWNVTFPSVVNEVCDLFGVEAEQATDPVEEKARELYRAATPDARWETVADEYRRIAAHVLGEESHD